MKKEVSIFLVNLVLFLVTIFLLTKNYNNEKQWKVIGAWICCSLMFLIFLASLYVLVKTRKKQ